jgi:hypothetical protein
MGIICSEQCCLDCCGRDLYGCCCIGDPTYRRTPLFHGGYEQGHFAHPHPYPSGGFPRGGASSWVSRSNRLAGLIPPPTPLPLQAFLPPRNDFPLPPIPGQQGFYPQPQPGYYAPTTPPPTLINQYPAGGYNQPYRPPIHRSSSTDTFVAPHLTHHPSSNYSQHHHHHHRNSSSRYPEPTHQRSQGDEWHRGSDPGISDHNDGYEERRRLRKKEKKKKKNRRRLQREQERQDPSHGGYYASDREYSY